MTCGTAPYSTWEVCDREVNVRPRFLRRRSIPARWAGVTTAYPGCGLPRLACVCTVLVGVCAGAGSAVAAPVARIDRIQLAPRAHLYAAAWSKSKNTYDSAYVNPVTRSVHLSGCTSRGDDGAGLPSAPSSLSWLLEPLDGQPGAAPMQIGPPAPCDPQVRLRAMGRWRITLTATDAAGLTDTTVREVVFRDVLIAAIGDSFTSGEGNPPWVDGQCHRSRSQAWPYLVARSLENDLTAVTFVSFACSGSNIEQLVDQGYVGQRRDSGGERLRPQLAELRTLLGDPTLPATRTVDLLLGSTGIGELDASGILKTCAEDRFSGTPLRFVLPDCEQDFSATLARLPGLYDELELAISSRLRVAQFDVIGYPARLLTDGRDAYPKKFTGLFCGPICKTRAIGCFPFEDLRVADKQFITRTVVTVNDNLAQAARRSNWWTRTPTLDIFRHHGYCTLGPPGGRWFVHPDESMAQQGNIDGTAHPNGFGHLATAREVEKSVRLDAAAPAADTFVVSILKLRLTVVDDSDRPPEERWTHGLVRAEIPGAARLECRATATAHNANAPAGQCLVFVVHATGNTIAVRAHVPVSRFVPRRPRDPAEPDAGHGVVSDLLAQHFHRRASNWQVAQRQHIIVHGAAGTLELEYKVTKPGDGQVVGPPLSPAADAARARRG